MALLTQQTVILTGTDPLSQAASATGDTFPNRPGQLLVRNTDTVAHTVTIKSFAKVRPGISASNIVVNVPAGATRLIGSFGPGDFSNADGNVEATYDAITGMTVAFLG
jgi:hypothetical protein